MNFDEDSDRRKLLGAKVVSLDIFDTALRRRVVSPHHLFLILEARLSERFGPKALSFAQHRLAAETEAWKRARLAHPCAQITLANIYDVFSEKHHLTSSESIEWQHLEIQIEKEFTYPLARFRDLYAHARESGLEVIFISDMYLPSAALRDILEHHGFSQPRVCVSAEEGGNKARGRLYRIIQNKMGHAPSDFLHFGDNYYADYFRARLNGWQAVYVPRPRLEPFTRKDRKTSVSIDSHLFSKLLRRDAADNLYEPTKAPSPTPDASVFWDDLGFNVVGPVYFHFLHWLSLQAKADRVTRLLLCSRDGFPLLHAFEILRKKWNVPIETTYFYSSRRLFNLVALQEINAAALDFLLMPNPGFRLRDFISRLNLDPEAYAPELLRLGFTSLDQELVHSGFGRFINPIYRQHLETWIKLHQQEILAQSERERARVCDYLTSVQPGRSDTAIVDLGWKGTVSAAMYRLLREMGTPIASRTYFFGTYEPAHRLSREGLSFQSFLFHLGKPARRKSIVARNEGLVELLFCAPHGSILGLTPGTTVPEPIYGECEYDETMLRNLTTMRNGAYRFIEQMADIMPFYDKVQPASDEVEELLTQLTCHPTKDQARHLGQIPYRVSYGIGGRTQALAEIPILEPYKWQDDLLAFERSHWKEGYLAQVSFPRRCFLKAALFIHSVHVALTSKTLLASLRWLLFKR